jgi:DNA-binding response OmpR family regulator
VSNTALLASPAPVRHLRAVSDVPQRPAVAAPAASAATATGTVPVGTAPRGFALYVGIDEAKAAADGVSLSTLVEALRRTLGELAPTPRPMPRSPWRPRPPVAVTSTSCASRSTSRAPSPARSRTSPRTTTCPEVTIDISRRRVHIEGETAQLTFKEFELLQYLVLREGRTIERAELVSSLWSHADAEEAPGERTIDVHVRRLRSKLGRYEDIVRTVRGIGYRFDRHADVVIRYGHGTPSPDRF